MTAWGWVAPKGRRSLTVYASSAPPGQELFDDPVHGLRSRLRRALHPWLQASTPSGRCGRGARYLPETLLAWFVDCPEGAPDCSHGWSGDSRGTRGCRFGDLSPQRGEGVSRCTLPLPLRGRGSLTILSTGCARGFAARFTRGYRPAPLRGAAGGTPDIFRRPCWRGLSVAPQGHRIVATGGAAIAAEPVDDGVGMGRPKGAKESHGVRFLCPFGAGVL